MKKPSYRIKYQWDNELAKNRYFLYKTSSVNPVYRHTLCVGSGSLIWARKQAKHYNISYPGQSKENN